jgi:GntR family transcriptional regulator, rspAB operon transcriptional repressor
MEAKAKSYAFLENVRSPSRGGATARVVDALREAIVSLELEPGSVLDKAALCERLGVSRFPISEALSRLQAEGLVEIQPQRGTIVSLIRLSDAYENMFVRRSLETAAARELAGRIDEPTLASLRRNLRYQKAAVEAGDQPGFHKLDLEFHEILLDFLGYPKVKTAAESARQGLDRIRRLLASPERHARTRLEHERILEALAAGDGERAASAMTDHLEAVMVQLLTLANKQPGLFADHGDGRR